MTSSTSSASNSIINTSGISVGSDGKVKISGLSSGIDWQSLINATITADSQPAVNLQTKITANTTKISAYGDLKTKASALTSALEALRGDPSYGSNDVFKTKSATGTTAAAAGAPAGYVPSDITDLLVASVSSSAANGNYQLTVNQLAQADQVRSDAQNVGSNDDLGLTGTLTLNGTAITVTTSDSLLDIRSKINASAAGVTATVVSASATSSYLVLTSTATGTANAITFGGDATLSNQLGLTSGTDSNGNPAAKNQLQQAMDAIMTVNGIPGITRSSNTVSDVIEGVTLSLQKAEPNTVINLSVSPDLSTIETAITTLVSAYNDMRDYVTDQRTNKDWNNDGTVDSDEYGPLAFDSTLRSVTDMLSTISGTVVGGNTDGYQSLAQLGITMGDDYKLTVDTSTLDSKLINNVSQVQSLFGLNVTSSDSRVMLLDRGDDTVSGTYYLNVAGTDASGNVTSANLEASAGNGNGGANDGTVTASGNTLTVNATSQASGLKLLFSGGNNSAGLTDATVTVSRGIADQAYDFFNGLTETTTGTLDTMVSGLQQQDTDYQTQIDTINARMDVERANLVTKYTNMETALSKMDSLKQTIQGYADSLNNSSN